MLRKAGLLVAPLLLTVLLVPGAGLAWHESSAVIDDVRYSNEAGGVTFYVDFRIWDHLGYTGAVRVRITDGIKTIVGIAYFQPAYDAASYRDFAIYISNVRLINEGAFFARNLYVTVDILDVGGNVLTRDSGLMTWALGLL